jgi:hypothetical protein
VIVYQRFQQKDRDKHFYETKCAALDRQIDSLAYKLYESTDDEIALAEGQGQ